MKLLPFNPLKTLLDRFSILLSYTPFLSRFLRFLRAKTPTFLMGRSKPSDKKGAPFALQLLSQQSHAVLCHHCETLLSPRLFEQHVFEKHGAPAACVWCEQISGTRGEKLESIQLKPPEPLVFARNEELHQPPADPTPPLFHDDNLDLAASYVQIFVDPKETHAWYHVTVSEAAFNSFCKALDEDKGHTRTLDFSCWCDAGPTFESSHRRHRHMIVVSPAHHFEQHVWPKVTVYSPSHACKSLERLASPMQLVDALGSLSSSKSICETGAWQEGNEHHESVFKTLPADYKLPLCVLWDGGLEELLYEWKFKNVDLSRVMQSPVSFVDGQWRQQIKDFYDLEVGLVAPVSKKLAPTLKPRRDDPLYTFHLLEGKKVYFYYSRRMGSLNRSKWLQKQMEGGNCFFENIGEAMWTMGPSDQEKLSRLMLQAEGSEASTKEEAKEEEKDMVEGAREETKESGEGSGLESERMDETKEAGQGSGLEKERKDETKEAGEGSGQEKERMDETKESGEGSGQEKEMMEETKEVLK